MIVKKLSIVFVLVAVCSQYNAQAMHELTRDKLTPAEIPWREKPFTDTGLPRDQFPTPLFEALALGKFQLALQVIQNAEVKDLFHTNNSGLVPFNYLLSYKKDGAHRIEQVFIEIQKTAVADLYFNRAGDKGYELLSRRERGASLWRCIVANGNLGIIGIAMNVAKKRTQ